MLRTALAVTSLIFGIEINADSTALADPPYQNCNEAHANGRYSIPTSDPAYDPAPRPRRRRSRLRAIQGAPIDTVNPPVSRRCR
jgi:hypothetical protein